jgi:predicted NodU family carbamoyl transferase
MGIIISFLETHSGGSTYGGGTATVDGNSATIIQIPGSYTFTSPEKLAKKLLDKIYDDIDMHLFHLENTSCPSHHLCHLQCSSITSGIPRALKESEVVVQSAINR